MYLQQMGISLVIYVLNAMDMVTSHGIKRLQVILIIQTVKMIIRVALSWAVIFKLISAMGKI